MFALASDHFMTTTSQMITEITYLIFAVVVDVSDECLRGEDEKHFKGMFGPLKLTELMEFPKNTFHTPNPLNLSCCCHCSHKVC